MFGLLCTSTETVTSVHPLQQYLISKPLQRVAVDLLGPLEPPTAEGNRYVVVFIYYMTKWTETYPLPDLTAETIVYYFMRVCEPIWGASLTA